MGGFTDFECGVQTVVKSGVGTCAYVTIARGVGDTERSVSMGRIDVE